MWMQRRKKEAAMLLYLTDPPVGDKIQAKLLKGGANRDGVG